MMKKLSYIILSFALVIVSVNSVSALDSVTCGDKTFYADSNYKKDNGIQICDESGTCATYYEFNFHTKSSTAGTDVVFSAYCRDPGASPGVTIGKNLNCESVVLDPTSGILEKNTYDAGIAAILKAAGTNTSGSRFVAVETALRVYEKMFPNYTRNVATGKTSYKLTISLVNKLLEDTDIKNYLSSLEVRVSPYSSSVTYKSFSEPGIEAATIALVKTGLKAASDYKNGNHDIEINGFDAPIKSADGKTLTFNISTKNFSSNGSVIVTGVRCLNDACNIAAPFLSSGRNKELVNGGTVVVTFTGETCEDVELGLDISYKDDYYDFDAYSIFGCPSSQVCQRFYILTGNNGARTMTKEVKTNICGNTPDDCTASVTNVECTSNPQDLVIREGIEGNKSSCDVVFGSDNVNILKCIIGNKDEAGNSYEAKTIDLRAGTGSSNRFCKVYCSEKYNINLPGAKQVNSGRFFSVDVNVEGNKYCYSAGLSSGGGLTTNRNLDETYLNNALEKARRDIIDAWNEWSKWQVAYSNNNITGIVKFEIDASDNSCSATCTPGENGCPANGCSSQCSGSVKATGYKKVWNWPKMSYNGSVTNQTETVISDSQSAECNCDSCIANNATEEEVKQKIRDGYNGTESELNARISEYYNIISEWNKCAGGIDAQPSGRQTSLQAAIAGWDITYRMDPNVKFWYTEDYFMETFKSNGGIDLIKKDISDGSKSSEGYRSVTTGYEGTSSQPIGSYEDLAGKGPLCYLEAGTNTYGNPNYVCTTVHTYRSTVTYVKKSITGAKKAFETPTLFGVLYPSGKIVLVNDENAKKNNLSIIEKAFPVGLGSQTGTHTYNIKLSNLGEYFDSGELGRVWNDRGNNVVSALINNHRVCYTDTALTPKDPDTDQENVYRCSYKVNCPDCPPVCVGKCEPDCPDCPVVSNGSLFTNNNINVSFRQITPSAINPNKRPIGVNWKFDENNITTSLELKAAATTNEIQAAGENIYDVNNEDGQAWVVKLTPTIVNDINKNKKPFTDNTKLKCYDYEGNKNVLCYSETLDSWIEEYPDNFKAPSSRPSKSERKNYKCNSNKGCYWKTWSMVDNHDLSLLGINTSIDLHAYKCIRPENSSETDCIGPSWK